MARIELRDCTILFKDGLSGTGAVNDGSIMAGDSSLGVTTIVLNSNDTDLVPVGARFTIAGEASTPTHVVTGRTPSNSSPTTAITFSPVLSSGVTNTAVITFTSQQLEIKIGGGDLSYTEKNDFTYELDRSTLDTVRENDDQPMEISIDLVYEHITTGTSETVSPMDALKRQGGAAEWVSSSSDLCEPYALNIELLQEAPCGSNEDETTLFPDFRSESRQVSLKDATIKVTGKCNAVEPTVTRG